MPAPAVLALSLVAVAIVAQRLAELRRARRNEAWARALGAVEYGAGHYPAFFVLHIGWLLSWILEAWLGGPRLSPLWPSWLLCLGAAEGLRYWAISALGQRWNTRILVLPGEPLVRRGPYRVLTHPNYVAVVIELAVVPLMFDAWITTVVAGAANAVLLLGVRIPAETRALREAAPETSASERAIGAEDHEQSRQQ